MAQWLVRTADNRIRGPFAKDQVRELLQSGKLGLRDEICPGNGHWIFLHEKEEVADQLGQDALQWLVPTGFRGDEATQTQTEPSLENEGAATGAGLGEVYGAQVYGDEAQTTVIRRLGTAHVPTVISGPGARTGILLKGLLGVLIVLLLFLFLSRV